MPTCAILCPMNLPELLTIDEAAARLSVSRRSLYRLIEAGELPTVPSLTPAGPHRIRPEDIAAFIARRTGTVVDIAS